MISKKLTINPIGGLANRMRAIASALSLTSALSSGAREPDPEHDPDIDLDIVWSKNRELNAAFDEVFLTPSALIDRIHYPSELLYNLLYSNPRKKNLFVTALTSKRYGLVLYDFKDSYRQQFGDDDDGALMLSAVRTALGRGDSVYIQSGTIFYPFDVQLYSSLFKPAPDIAAESAERIGKLGKHSVGLHIRRTDNAMSIKHSPTELFVDKVASILSGQPDTRFYLATDSQDIKELFVRKFGDAIVTSRAVADRNSVAGIKEAAVEMFTLAGTDRIFGSFYSSFSEAAAMLGNRPFEQLTV